jgi:geranylgeranyl pyrophosphate synthase
VTLSDFLAAVYRRAEQAIDAPPFHATQRALLHAVLAGPRARAEKSPLGDPLSVIYLVCRAHRRALDEQALWVATFCLFYLLSLDLFDDVQDEDLDKGPHAQAGAAIAINDAITLGFLANDALRRAVAIDPLAGETLLELAPRIGLLAVAGQHRDLTASAGSYSPEEVIAMQQAKTSSAQLLAECGAILARCDAEEHRCYRALGEDLAVFIQIRDDLRDVFGKDLSPDLKSGKVTYPLACFHQRAGENDRAELGRLVDELPRSMPALRKLFYRSGAVAAAAQALESRRRAIHAAVAALGGHAALRTLLDVVDGLAEAIYTPPSLPATARLWEPPGGWHALVRDERARFVARMSPHGAPPLPALRPWHHPHWMYLGAKRTIYYPDVDALPDDVLSFQAQLLDADVVAAREVALRQLPAVVAHEMFHAWRDAAGRLTDDHWHEEWAANRLAVAYAARHAEGTLAATAELCAGVVARFADRLDAGAEEILARSSAYRGPSGYGLDMLATAVVTLEMVRRLIAERPCLDGACEELLRPRAGPALSRAS